MLNICACYGSTSDNPLGTDDQTTLSSCQPIHR
jgi:hypothetical protein